MISAFRCERLVEWPLEVGSWLRHHSNRAGTAAWRCSFLQQQFDSVSWQLHEQALLCSQPKVFPLPPLLAFQGLPESEHSHSSQPVRSKTPQIPQDAKGPAAAGPEQSHHPTVNRHAAQIEPHVHLQRAQADTGQTSYPSPVAISMKQELPSPHQPQAVPKQSMFIPTTSGPGAPPGLPLNRPEPQSALKQEPSPHAVSQRPVDMVQLLTVSVGSGLFWLSRVLFLGRGETIRS